MENNLMPGVLGLDVAIANKATILSEIDGWITFCFEHATQDSIVNHGELYSCSGHKQATGS